MLLFKGVGERSLCDKTCSNLFICPRRPVGKRVIGLRLKGLLVTFMESLRCVSPIKRFLQTYPTVNSTICRKVNRQKHSSKIYNQIYVTCSFVEQSAILWLIHTARDRERDRDGDRDGYNRKQWLPVPVPV